MCLDCDLAEEDKYIQNEKWLDRCKETAREFTKTYGWKTKRWGWKIDIEPLTTDDTCFVCKQDKACMEVSIVTRDRKNNVRDSDTFEISICSEACLMFFKLELAGTMK